MVKKIIRFLDRHFWVILVVLAGMFSHAPAIAGMLIVGAVLHATDRGHQEMLSVYFQNSTAATNFYVALLLDTIVGTDDWADVSANEVLVGSNPGYAQVAIARDGTASGWPTLALDSGDMQITGMQCTFTASGDWGTAVTAIAVVANMATDRLIFYSNVSSISLLNGESIAVTPKFKLVKV